MKINRKTVNIGAAIAAVGIMALALANAQQAAPAKPAEPKYTEIKYSADASSYKWVGDDRILSLKGNVKFVQGDTVLLADKVDYRESTRSATASGNLKIYDDRNTITSDSCSIDFKEKKGALTGNVHMTVKPKQKPQTTADDKNKLLSEIKDEATITCASVDYFYKEKKAVIPSAVTIVQKTKTITADSATYTGNDELVVLTGNVKALDDKDKHSFTAPKVTMSLKKDNEWIDAEKASGSFFVKDNNEESKPTEPAPIKKP